jgi:malate dehydrogenase (oxaloacetate-decarboxylating)
LKNQINNASVFPGIFRGIHEHDLIEITQDMKEFVSILIAQNIDREPTQRHIIVDSLDLDIPVLIAKGLEKFKNTPEQQPKNAKL